MAAGITLRYGAQNTRIGTDGDGNGFDENERNVISGNGWVGIRVMSPEWWGLMPPGGATTDGTIIAGNYIGLNAAGNATLGNSSAGIYTRDMPTNLRIGTDGNGIADEAERNVISGNGGNGVQVEGWTTMNLLVTDQLISGDIPGTAVSSTVSQADLFDPTSGPSGNWEFNHEIPGGGGDRYAFEATGTLQVNTTGFYTFAMGGDDGSRLRIDGVDVIRDDTGHAFTDFFGSVQLTAGTHTFQWVGFEGGSEAGFELAVAVGDGVSGPVTESNGWRVVGASNPHPEIALVSESVIDVTTFYPSGDLNMTIAGNYIGTDPTGELDFGNSGSGVYLLNRAQGVTIGTNGDGNGDVAERNIISGNSQYGVIMNGAGVDNNVLAGNYIGTNAGGSSALGNSAIGVHLLNGASNNIIGTDGNNEGDSAEGNVISANNSNGVDLFGNATRNNRIAGNYIGTDATGNLDLGNTYSGILVNRAQGTIVGTNSDGVSDALEGNLISGNNGTGVTVSGDRELVDTLTDAERFVDGTYASTIASGTITHADIRDIQGAAGNWGFNNPVPGGGGDDYVIVATGTFDVAAAGAYSFSLGGDDGGRLRIDGVDVVVDGTFHGFREFFGSTNLSAGTHTFEWLMMERWFGSGWELAFKPGTHTNGPANAANGWTVLGDSGADISLVGDIDLSVYYSDLHNDIPTTIAGNLIGTNAAGTNALANNSVGVIVQIGAQNTRIGTDGDGVSDTEERNVISGNGNDGIRVRGSDTDNTVIAGNFIGTDISGTVDLGNGDRGILVHNGASNTRIGTDGSDDAFNENERNVISGNTNQGVRIQEILTRDSVVAGNYIGTDVTGTLAIENSEGIRITNFNDSTRIGTNADGVADLAERNIISGNRDSGIRLANASHTSIAGNFIGTDPTGTISVANGRRGGCRDPCARYLAIQRCWNRWRRNRG